MESAKNIAIDAERAFDVGHALETLFNEYDASVAKNPGADAQEFRDRYGEILANARIKHSPIDYRFFQLSNPGQFPRTPVSRTISMTIYAAELLRHNWLYLVMVGVPLVAAGLLAPTLAKAP